MNTVSLAGTEHTIDLKGHKVFIGGCSTYLDSYIREQSPIKKGSIAFFGDNYITDCFAASSYQDWESICIVEELAGT
jgi:hypothetical protein